VRFRTSKIVLALTALSLGPAVVFAQTESVAWRNASGAMGGLAGLSGMMLFCQPPTTCQAETASSKPTDKSRECFLRFVKCQERCFEYQRMSRQLCVALCKIELELCKEFL
jgi:hypothetical protein